jgi:flagellar protein FliL
MPETPEAEAPKKKGKMKMMIPVIVLVVGLGGGGFFFMSASSKKASASAPTTTTTAVGPTIPLADITTNLSDGHVLKVGISLELAAKPKNKDLAAIVAASAASSESSSSSSDSSSYPLQGQESKALDITISTLGDDTYTQLTAPGGREAAKAALSQKIEDAYGGDVLNVYFTDFVMS